MPMYRIIVPSGTVRSCDFAVDPVKIAEGTNQISERRVSVSRLLHNMKLP